MADFVAVIRRAVDGLADNTPENRGRVYDKARGAVRRQLESMSPAPSDAVVRQQIDKLDAAIDEVELEHTEALPAEEEAPETPIAVEPDADAQDPPGPKGETDDSGATETGEREAAEEESAAGPEPDGEAGIESPVEPGVKAGEDVPAVAGAAYRYEPAWHSEPDDSGASADDDRSADEYAKDDAFLRETGAIPSSFDEEQSVDETHDTAFGLGEGRPTVASRKTRRRRSGVVTLVFVLIVAAVAYGLWTNRTSVGPLLASLSSLTSQTSGSGESPANPAPSTSQSNSPSSPAGETAQTPATQPGSAASGESASGNETNSPDTPAGPPEEESAGNDQNPSASKQTSAEKQLPEPDNPAQDKAAQPARSGPPEGGKFTQRLLADGSETNPGPAPDTNPSPANEGRSVAEQSASESGAAVENGASADSISANTPGAAAGNAAAGKDQSGQAAISQKMYLYEERFKDKAPSATTGSVVWSLVKESPGGDAAPVPAIHGEISLPDKGMTALVTIKPNADTSLPASDLIEIVFALPGDFAGGGINSVERVSMKQTEEARGDPLIAVPAKITDNFFMVALNDYPEAVKSNLDLLKSRNWIDIPITYTSGRRALITLEKGAAGNEVFDKALQAWAKTGDGTAASQTGTKEPAAPTGGSSDADDGNNP